MAEFHCFARLPTELRLHIWQNSLQEIDVLQPHICTYRKGCWKIEPPQPGDIDYVPGNPQDDFCQRLHLEDLQVEIPVPHLAVSQEARLEALEWAGEADIFWSRAHNSPVRCRPFDVDRDVLYVPKYLSFFDEPWDQGVSLQAHITYAEVRAVAFSFEDATLENLSLDDLAINYEHLRTFLLFTNPGQLQGRRSVPCRTEHFRTLRLSAEGVDQGAVARENVAPSVQRDLDRLSHALCKYSGFNGWYTVDVQMVTALV